MWQIQCLDIARNNQVMYDEPLDLQTPKARLNPPINLITPESPSTYPQVKLDTPDFKKEYESPPENTLRTTLFRPWDTPESLSPTSDNISPTSNQNSSPPTYDGLSSSSFKQTMFHVPPSNKSSAFFAGCTVTASSLEEPQAYNIYSSPLEVPSTPILPPTSNTSPSFHYHFSNTLQSPSLTPLQRHSLQSATQTSFFTSPQTWDVSPPFLGTSRTSPSPLSVTSYISPSTLSVSTFVSPLPVPTYVSPPGASTISPPNLLLASRGMKRMRQDDVGASPTFAKKAKLESTPLKGSHATPLRGSRGPLPPCGVCDDPSTGQHYGAPVCEGCKVYYLFHIVFWEYLLLLALMDMVLIS